MPDSLCCFFLFFSCGPRRFGFDSLISGCQWVEIVKNRTIFDVPPKTKFLYFREEKIKILEKKEGKIK